MQLKKIISLVLILALIFPATILISTELASASQGGDLDNGFLNLLSKLLDLLFFGLFETEQPTSNSTEASDNSSPVSVTIETDWTAREVTSLTKAEEKMVEMVNQARVKKGLSPLKVDYRLVKIARAKSRDLIKEDYFSHYSPNYGSPFDMMRKLNINYYLAGENLAGASSVEVAFEELMKSKSHRNNILHPDFTHIGIGIIEGGPYEKMYTQEFVDLED
ncbi:uncharacterized protein with SCP/PR1 domains [Halobacteroides halobius DSM 5150]|uniref:Uncharacterized protein with SCP/PR1 domains n=1 Tax=Halobacteroides halobius (strain ATCC 35273 / DSM 5150 / MD-1) TaxID=748449 RepID=L0K511_HALHC|nr:CAP domain-containing protein [Halobacteroides halobius]AGB40106.1 uncharacterized protein with SCP/PR1 domains [Halobacteroides halobius DSM 5150]